MIRNKEAATRGKEGETDTLLTGEFSGRKKHVSRKGKPARQDGCTGDTGRKKGFDERAAARSAILRHLATANRRIKRTAE